MEKLMRYNYDGHNIIIKINNHDESSYFNREDTDIYIDGELLPRTRGDFNSKINFTLSNGEKCEFVCAGKNAHLLINGERQEEFHAKKTTKLNIENMRALSKLKPITALSEYDFWAIKKMRGDAFVQHYSYSKMFSIYAKPFLYLKVSDRECSPDQLQGQITPPDKKDFVRIKIGDVQPGDTIYVQSQMIPYKYYEIQNVQNIALESAQLDRLIDIYAWGSTLRNVEGFLIQGENVTSATIDIEGHGKRLQKAIADIGFDLNELINAIPSTTTIEEFQIIQSLHAYGINITEEMLQDLANGKDVREIIDRETMFAERATDYMPEIQEPIKEAFSSEIHGLDRDI